MDNPEQSYTQRAEAAKAKAEAPEAVANALTVHTSTGPVQVVIDRFPALEGYEISRAYRNFAMSKDAAFRRAFVLDVLKYATVGTVQLDTPEIINNALETWRNVERVFYAALESNDIDRQLEEEKANYWAVAGADLAASFIAASAKLLLPLMQSMEDEKQAEQGE